MEAFSFGSYCPGSSAIHRMDPRAKLLLGFVFLIVTLTVQRFVGLVPVAVFVALIYAVARMPYRRILSSMAPLLAIVFVVAVLNLFTDQAGRVLWQLGPLQISEGSLHSATFMGMPPHPDDGRHERHHPHDAHARSYCGFRAPARAVRARGATCA